MDEVLIRVEDLALEHDHFNKKDIVTLSQVIAVMQEMEYEIDNQQEKIQDLEEQVSDLNPSPYKEYGISEKDFY